MRRKNFRSTTVNLDAGLAKDVLVDAVEPRDLLVLVGEQRRPVEFRLADRPAEGARDLEVLAEMRGVGKQLLRDAADVDAGAAEAVGFRNRDLRAERRGNAAGANAAGAASYGEEVVIELQGYCSTSGS
jgi:hypothetical protein